MDTTRVIDALREEGVRLADTSERRPIRTSPASRSCPRPRRSTATQPADCTVRGPAADLYLALWNRGGLDALTIDGDASLLDLFREKATIR